MQIAAIAPIDPMNVMNSVIFSCVYLVSWQISCVQREPRTIESYRATPMRRAPETGQIIDNQTVTGGASPPRMVPDHSLS